MWTHYRHYINIARNTLYAIRRYSGSSWRFSFTGMRKIYKVVFEGIVLYAAPVWAPLLKYKKYREILLRAQRSALILITKAFCTVSNVALQVIAAAIMPIDFAAELRTTRYLQRQGKGPFVTLREARDTFYEHWEKRWADSEQGIYTRQIWPTVAERMAALKYVQVDFFLAQA